MRIYHLLAGRVNPDQADGIQFHTFGLARAQANQGEETHIIGVSAKADEHQRVEREGVVIHAFPAGPHPFALHEDLQNFLSQRPPMMAHIQVPLEPQMNAVSRFLRRAGIPYVLSTHALWSPLMLSRRRWRKLAYKFAFDLPMARGALAIHATAEAEVVDIQRYAPGVPVFVIRNAIDLETIDSVPPDASFWSRKLPRLREGVELWCFLGRLDPYQKGLDLLLDAWNKVDKESGRLHLALIGPFWRDSSKKLRDQVTRLGLSDTVHFVGPLHGREKYQALKAASFYVQTSRFETTPYSIQEALACGLPVVVTEGTNFGQDVLDYRAGRCEPFDASAVAEAIVVMSNQDSSVRDEMRTRARRLVEDRHSMQLAAAQMTQTYSALLRRDHRS
jgi:glycosyltransferase involved in cell wall biosynthesis